MFVRVILLFVVTLALGYLTLATLGAEVVPCPKNRYSPSGDERGLGAPCSFFFWFFQDLIMTVVSNNTFMTLMFVRRALCVVHMRPCSPWKPRSGGRSWNPGTKPWGASKYPKAVYWKLSMEKNNLWQLLMEKQVNVTKILACTSQVKWFYQKGDSC